MLSTILIVVAIQIFGLGVRRFAVVNLGLIVLWLVISTYLNREHANLTRKQELPASSPIAPEMSQSTSV